MTQSPAITPDIPDRFSALLKFEGGEADHHQASAENLVAVLSGMQRIAYLLAAQDSGLAIGERLKPSRAMKQAYALHCGTPQAGSYAVPMMTAPVAQHQLEFDPPGGDLLDRIREIWQLVVACDRGALQQLLAPELAKRVLLEIQKILPKEQEGIRLSLWTRDAAAPACLDWQTNQSVKTMLEGPASTDAVMTVTGDLLKIDFANRQVTILYPPGREIVCTYLPEVEDTLVDARKEPFQVTGRFVLDDQGIPLRLMDVSRIEPLDLSPLIITTVPSLGLRLRLPLELCPSLDDDSQQYLCVALPSIGLDVFALTREQLFEEVHEQLAMLWTEFALESDERLDSEALEIKRNLHQLMEVTGNAEA